MADNKKNKKPKDPKSESDYDGLDTVKELMQDVEYFYTDFSEHIYRARDFLTFLYVDQWDQQIRLNRENLSKPTLTFNKITPMLRAILGEQRNETPALAVRDLTIDYRVPQAQIDNYTDYIRQVFFESDADVIWQLAFKSQMECGWGSARVCIKYDGDTFKQCMYIEPIMDYQAAFWDPLAQKNDKSDGRYCGVHQIMSREQFKREYPNVEVPQSATIGGSDYYLPWLEPDAIVICEEYRKEFFNKTIVELNNGKTLEEKDANELLKMQDEALAENENLEMLGYQRLEITNKRVVRDYKIKHYKFISNKLLDETDYPGKILPIVYGEGDSAVIDGRRIPIPFVQDAIDTQKLINYIGSEMAYTAVRARKETVMGVQDNFDGNPDDWRNPDQVQGAITYKPGPNGEKPEFITPPVMSPVYMDIYQNSSQDLQQTLGRYEEARGQESNAQSGIAIAERKSASNLPVNVYQNNNSRLIKQIGRIILDLIPHIHDNEQTVVVRGPDNQTRHVIFNHRKGLKLNSAGEMEDDVENDTSMGKYDVEIRVDGSFDDQKAAALDFLLKLAAINPAVANLIPDMVAENSGLENTAKLIERLQTLVPPDILAKEKGLPPPPPPPAPPPPPEIMVAQIKGQTDIKIAQMRQASEIAKIQMEAKAQGKDYQATYQQALADIIKSNAEVIKSNNSVKEAALNHSATITSSHSDFAQTLINAETKRAALDAQSRQLRGIGL